MFQRLLLAASCAALFAFPSFARAERHPTSERKSLIEQVSFGPFYYLPAPVGTPPVVTPLATPIYFPLRTGSVSLAAHLHGGTTSGVIGVTVGNYAAGAYTVSAITESSSSTVVLGALDVTAINVPPNVLSAVPTPAVIVVSPIGITTGSAVFGTAANPFPSGFSPFDVASIFVSDSNSNVVASAVLTPPSNGNYTALSPLAPGTDAPGATGFALIRATFPPHFYPIPLAAAAAVTVVPPISFAPTGRLVLHAHGLPPDTAVTYAADGTTLGHAATDSSGNLKIFAAQGEHRKIPVALDLSTVRTVTVKDGSGNVLVSADF